MLIYETAVSDVREITALYIYISLHNTAWSDQNSRKRRHDVLIVNNIWFKRVGV